MFKGLSGTRFVGVVLLIQMQSIYAAGDILDSTKSHKANNSKVADSKFIPFAPEWNELPKSALYPKYHKELVGNEFLEYWQTVEGLQAAAGIDKKDPNLLDIDFKRKSSNGWSAEDFAFCSSGVDLHLLLLIEALQKRKDNSYAVLRNKDLNKALTDIGDPKEVIDGKLDGMGFFGHVNANGPGLAVLFKKLKLGRNMIYDPNLPLRSGDYLKVFWGDVIGNGENGHLVVVDKRGKVDGESGVWVWSSNKKNADGSSGYGKMFISDKRIKYGIVSRLEHPENFILWNTLAENEKKDEYLKSLNKERTVHMNNPDEMTDFEKRFLN